MCGDFNVHTLTLSDFCYTYDDDDDDQATVGVPYANLSDYDIPTGRANQDITSDRNSYGRKMVEICKNNQVFIFNGRLEEDCGVGKSTTTYRITIDYVLGSPSVMQLVETFKVLDYDPMLSDIHCGLYTKFIFKCQSKETNVRFDTQVVLECVKPGK